MELNTAVKPYALHRMFEDRGYETLLYIDPDIKIYAPLAEVQAALAEANIALIPHMRRPVPRRGEPGGNQHPAERDLQPRLHRPAPVRHRQVAAALVDEQAVPRLHRRHPQRPVRRPEVDGPRPGLLPGPQADPSPRATTSPTGTCTSATSRRPATAGWSTASRSSSSTSPAIRRSSPRCCPSTRAATTSSTCPRSRGSSTTTPRTCSKPATRTPPSSPTPIGRLPNGMKPPKYLRDIVQGTAARQHRLPRSAQGAGRLRPLPADSRRHPGRRAPLAADPLPVPAPPRRRQRLPGAATSTRSTAACRAGW